MKNKPPNPGNVIDFAEFRKRLNNAQTAKEVKEVSDDIVKTLGEVSQLLSDNLTLFHHCVVNLAIDLQNKHIEADAILQKLRRMDDGK